MGSQQGHYPVVVERKARSTELTAWSDASEQFFVEPVSFAVPVCGTERVADDAAVSGRDAGNLDDQNPCFASAVVVKDDQVRAATKLLVAALVWTARWQGI